MNAQLAYGLLAGTVWAAADVLLFRGIIRRSLKNRDKASVIVAGGLLLRYFLTAAVLVWALLTPAVNAVGVIIPLILQKVVIVLFQLFASKKE